MWICQQCHTENRDTAPACETCGTLRSAGRFGSAPAQRSAVWQPQPPMVTQPSMMQESENAPAPQSVSRARSMMRAKNASANAAPPAPPVRKKRSLLAGFARFVGAALLILLPLLTAGLAYRQYEPLSQLLAPLLAGNPPPKGAQLGCYLAFAAGAVLLSALPGLWTLLLAKKSQEAWR